MLRSVTGCLMAVVMVMLSAGMAQGQQARDSVFLWYGNLDGSPVDVYINQHVGVDVYCMNQPAVYVADVHFVIGAIEWYIDSLRSHLEGEVYYPFTAWEVAEFLPPYDEAPGMPEGWSSQSFIGFARISGDAPWLHLEVPTPVLRLGCKTANDSTIIGDLVQAIGPFGRNPIQGPSNAGDTLGTSGYTVVEFFSPLNFRGAGYVEGVVTDPNDLPVPGVVVTNARTNKQVETDQTGFYHMGLYAGLHGFTFMHPNYPDTIVDGVSVVLDATTQLNMQLGGALGIEVNEPLPEQYEVSQNYPNPFNAATTIKYALPEDAHVTIEIYDILGRVVTTALNQRQSAGYHQYTWDAGRLSSGFYFYTVRANDFTQTRSMLLLK